MSRAKKKARVLKLWVVPHDHRPDLGDGLPEIFTGFTKKKKAKRYAEHDGQEVLGPFFLAARGEAVLGLPPRPSTDEREYPLMSLPCRVVLDVMEAELGPLRKAQILGRTLEHKDAANAFPLGARERKSVLHRSLSWLEDQRLVRSDGAASGEWRLVR